MGIAAVPAYLRRQDLNTASPGMRFGMLLPLWGLDERTGQALWKSADSNYRKAGEGHEERRFDDNNKVPALEFARKLTQDDLAAIDALAGRQAAIARSLVEARRLHMIEARSVAPFTTGLGHEHPLENGFSFLHPYGVPYLAGSGVKGVLRHAARELAGLTPESWQQDSGWTAGAVDALFGVQSEDGEEQWRGALSFWDVIPRIAGEALAIEVMTVHQRHYYQQKQWPHDSGQPNPIYFLTVPPMSGFAFHVNCDLVQLARCDAGLAQDGRWQALLEAAFRHAFDWLGFGAKTAVGYGAMEEDPAARLQREQAVREAAERAERERANAERVAMLAQLSPAERAAQEYIDANDAGGMPGYKRLIKGLKESAWTGETAAEIAAVAKRMMLEEGKWKETTNAKRPDKDKDHQDTLQVRTWLSGA